MKFYAGQRKKQLDAGLSALLKELRACRNFDAQRYVDAKVHVVNEYFLRSRLQTAVVAVSGGIDSAVVLAVLATAASRKGSPIKHIVPLTLPVFKSDFTKNQDAATKRAIEVIRQFGLKEAVYDLTESYGVFKKTIDESIGIEGEPWAAGQLVSYFRTPAIYYTTSLMSQEGRPAIVCGTTNRDEGSYLGFVGKASDAMVDIQVISDLHKSEVRAVARLLGVPQSILRAQPTGDMFDGRVDEDVFGASYDFVELFLLLQAIDDEKIKRMLIAQLPAKSKRIFTQLSDNLKDLHGYNAHKYRVGSPAAHLDVLESGVRGGWKYGYEKVDSEPLGEKYFVNAFSFTKDVYRKIDPLKRIKGPKERMVQGGLLMEFDRLLDKKEASFLVSQADAHGYKPVGVDGYQSHYREGDPVGSYRASVFSPELARVLWQRVSRYYDNPRVFNDRAATDIDGVKIWRPIGISPLFRYIAYTPGGLLVPHYDAPYVYSHTQRTLMSLVIYIEADSVSGGHTRYIKDVQAKRPFDERNFNDWTRFARKAEVLYEIVPRVGSAISFDHRMLHDSSEIGGTGRKIIVRTDIVFARCE